MKRFLMFRGDHYYPSGGWEDFVSSHDTLEQAREAAVYVQPLYVGDEPAPPDWAHIVDTQLGAMVDRGRSEWVPMPHKYIFNWQSGVTS